MASCGRSESCGGYFSPGPGDSDWGICDAHRADLPRFPEIYARQLTQATGGKVPVVLHFVGVDCDYAVTVNDPDSKSPAS